MDHTYSTVLLYFEYAVIISATFLFLFVVSCLPPGPALEDHVLFPSFFTFLLLVIDLDENGPRC